MSAACEDGKFVIRVRDYGPGIPEEDLATMRRCLERMDGNLNGICKEKR